MTKKTTKRALLLSVLSMMLCVAMLVGSTFAWFTDSVTSSMNTIVAGNLDVELYHTNALIKDTATDEEKKVDGKTTLFVSADENFQWEPGAILYENFTVKNAGSLALKYKLMLKAECNATEDGVSLENVLKVAVLDKAFNGDRAEAMKAEFNMTVAEFVASGAEIASGELLKKDDAENCAVIIYWEPTNNDDLYNFNNGRKEELYINLGVNLFATQTASESDSFGKDYDFGLELPTLPAAINTILTATVDSNSVTELQSENGMVKATIPAGALNEDVTDVTLSVETTNRTTNSVTYEIKLKDQDGNSITSNEPINAVLKVAMGIKNVKINHSGEPMAETDYSYDPKTGEVTIKTCSFSPFDVMFERISGWDGSTDSEGLVQSTNTQEKTVYINTPEQFAAFAQDVNAGNTYAGYTVQLTWHMDLNNVAWTPIGNDSKSFKGTFDGNGYTISNLKVEGSTQYPAPSMDDHYRGLFGQTRDKAVITNFTLKNVNVSGSCYVAAVCGYPYTGSEISKITVTGKVNIKGYTYVGGIGGYGYMKKVDSCVIDADEGSLISGEYIYVGGIFGFRGEGAQVTTNCSSNVDVKGLTYVGGISGILHYGNTIENCEVKDITVTLTCPGDQMDESDRNGIGAIAGIFVKGSVATIKNCSGTARLITEGNKVHDGIIGNDRQGVDSDNLVLTDNEITILG